MYSKVLTLPGHWEGGGTFDRRNDSIGTEDSEYVKMGLLLEATYEVMGSLSRSRSMSAKVSESGKWKWGWFQ